MELPLFDQVGELARTLIDPAHGVVRFRAHRRGVKVWLDTKDPSRFHYEAQLISRRAVDDTDGMAIEVGFHAEHRDEARNTSVVAALEGAGDQWRPMLGPEAKLGPFLGHAPGWQRLSETWVEPDLDEPDLAFELASRLADYVDAVQPHLRDQN